MDAVRAKGLSRTLEYWQRLSKSPLSGRGLLFVLWPRLLFGVGRRCCRCTLRLFCSAFGKFLLLTPFRFSALLFLPLQFLLALLKGDAQGSP